MSTSDCPKCVRREKTHSRRNHRKSLRRSGDFPSPSDGFRSGFQSTVPVPRQPDGTQPALRFQFARLLRSSPPSLPPSLDELEVGFESAFSRDYAHFTSLNTGKVKVIVCVRHPESTVECRPLSTLPNVDRQHHAPSQYLDALLSLNCNISSGCVTTDHRRNQLTLIDPTPPIRRRVSVTNPKLFTFDAVLATQDQQLLELSRVALTRKTRSMVGTDTAPPTSFGIIPCAISWLFQVLNKQKEVTGIRFSVRVSAVALNGPNEEFCDLLEDAVLPHENDMSPSRYLRSQERNPAANPTPGDIFQSTDSESVAMQISRCLANQKEIRVANAEKAAYLLDVALTKRAAACADKKNSSNTNGSGLSHMLFTFHVYQCCVEQNETGAHVSGGLTRLHLLDLGCGRYGHPTATTSGVELTKFKQTAQDKGQSPIPSTRTTSEIDRPATHNPINTTCRSLSISGMANVILALLTGQRHLPFRDSALTHLIKEAMTGTQVHPCVIAHIDSGTQYYTETLQNTSVSGTGVHVVKRMIPRTNAKVWPRAISPRLKEALLSQEETWIDGPKVAGTLDINLKATECVSSSGPHWSHCLCPSSSVCSPTYSVVQPRRHSSELGTAPCAVLSKSATVSTVAPLNIHDSESFRCAYDCTQENDLGKYPSVSHSCAWQTDNNAEDDQNQISSVDASSCSTLEHGAKLGPRALSDISERTEETETVPDGNTIKSSSTGPLFECLSLLRLEGLPYLDELHFEDRSAPHNAELIESVLADTTDRRQSPLKNDGTRNTQKADKSGRDELQQNPVFSPPKNQDLGNFSASQQTPYWNILQPDSFSFPRYPQTMNTTKHLVKLIAYPSTGDQVQNSATIRERADCTESIQAKELKDSKSQRGFRFPSFPIFRSFRLRRDRKKEKLQAADPLRVDENKAATQSPSTTENMTGLSYPLSPTSLADLRERCHSCSSISPMRSIRACASTFPHVAELTPGDLSLSVADSPHLVLKSTALQSGPSAGINAPDFLYRSVSSGPTLDVRATSSPLVKQLSRRESHGRQQQSFHLLRNDQTEGTVPVSASSHQMGNNQALFGLPNSPSVPLNSPNTELAVVIYEQQRSHVIFSRDAYTFSFFHHDPCEFVRWRRFQ
ncbi:kinesin motor domain protein [Opisthorchis viverrini]|uniref:Kinesin motor domain protein n=1 Tax=Opisthorchis viverrini TaxID=6198 RepID=A0A1S8XAX6_OPIVI|nr:kinesin motor domain protein [Opisthorchis viverrini]